MAGSMNEADLHLAKALAGMEMESKPPTARGPGMSKLPEKVFR